jgi:uncharacterized membrane protein
MVEIPWHPVLVHFPIALAVLIPIVALAIWFLNRGTKGSHKIWLLIPLLSALSVISTFAANHFGKIDTNRIAPLISDDAYLALESHSLAGENLFWLSIVMLGVSLSMYLLLPRFRWAPLGFVLISFCAMVPVLLVAQSGTALVYEHGLSEVGRR